MLCGEQAQKTLEAIIWGKLVAGTTVYYANGIARTDVNTAISLNDIRKVVRYLQSMKGKKINTILDGSPERGTPEEQAKFQWRPLSIESTAGPQRIALDFEKDADKGFTLRVYWNDQKVAEERITRVNRTTRVPMQVDLRADAKRQLSVAFDKFRLRQRQAR